MGSIDRKPDSLFTLHGDRLYLLSRDAVTKYHILGILNNRILLSHNSGGETSGIKVLTGKVPSEGCEGRTCFRPPSLACVFSQYVCV